ncbi:MFS transporter [Desmospora profundinema]|uniref:MFS family permease n=1 Tax=Desmospora profundinema TaxID=1571184 RepID=A0ABU1IQ24_9BACL|nr:MFS transporter [Desmospora profundinema]MDR6226880.1 MFS family permease [Desmospora profundinema]
MSQSLAVTEQQPQERKHSSLFRNHAFLFAWLSSLFTSFATAIYLLSESWYVVNHLKMGASLGLVLMATAIPRLLLMPIGGILADRIRRTRILFLSDCTRCGLLLIMVICFLLDVLTFKWLLVFALIYGVLDAFYWPASSSLIPVIVPKEQLAQANSIIEMTRQAGYMGGPLLGALVLTVASYDWLFGVIALILLFGALWILFIRDPQTRMGQEQENTSFLQDGKDVFLFARQDSFLIALLLTVFIVSLLLTGPLSVAIPLFVEQNSGTALHLSYLEISIAVGMLLGGLTIASVKLKKKRALLAWGCLSTFGGCVFSLGIASQWTAAILALLAGGVVLTMGNTLLVTLLQERTPTDKIGRVMSLVTTATTGLVPLSHGMVTMFLNNGVALSSLLLIFGGLSFFFCLILMATLKTIRTVD